MEAKVIDYPLFSFPPCKAPHLLNPIVLAYVGDAVYEMYIRQYLVSLPNQRPNHLHHQATTYVSAKAQAKALQSLLGDLSDEEMDMVKRGRNAKSGSSPKNTDVLEYRHSTAFECLIGYLFYMNRRDRIQQLMDLVIQLNED